MTAKDNSYLNLGLPLEKRFTLKERLAEIRYNKLVKFGNTIREEVQTKISNLFRNRKKHNVDLIEEELEEARRIKLEKESAQKNQPAETEKEESEEESEEELVEVK